MRSARKHIGWYVQGLPGAAPFRARMNTLEDAPAQLDAVAGYFEELGATHPRLPLAPAGLDDGAHDPERLAA